MRKSHAPKFYPTNPNLGSISQYLYPNIERNLQKSYLIASTRMLSKLQVKWALHLLLVFLPANFPRGSYYTDRKDSKRMFAINLSTAPGRNG